MINVTMPPESLRDKKLAPKITVIGVGGAGGNAVNNMIASKLEGVDFISCNTDAQALNHSLAPVKLQLGTTITSGLGAGSKPEIGRAAAEESIDDVMEQLDGANMVFVTAGMGGGTGTGAAPVIARAAKQAGILTVGVVTKPFHFEGQHRMRSAEAGIAEMQDYVDTLIVIPNQNLFRIANEKTTFPEAFKLADSVLQAGVRGVTDLMILPGLINLDFADIRCAMMEMGKAMMGTGEASGERRATEAAERAINNPLLDDISMKGARGVIINITGGYDMTLFEVDEACNRIRDEVDPDANIIFGSTFDDSLEGVMRVSVVATGIEAESMARRGNRTIRAANPNHPLNTMVAASEPVRTAPPVMSPSHTPSYASSYATQQLVVPPLSARPTTVMQGGVVAEGSALRRAEPELHQPVFQPVQPGYQPQPTAADQSRGARVGGAFIPPRPVEAAEQSKFQSQSYAQPAYAQPVEAEPQATQQPMQQQPQPSLTGAFGARPGMIVTQPEKPAGLVLNKPVPGQARKNKAPSLFERFAGIFQATDEGDELATKTETTTTTTTGNAGGTGGGMFAPDLRASRVMAPDYGSEYGDAQGSLNIDMAPTAPRMIQQPVAPAAPKPAAPQPQSDLDIPAFLRRQIS